MVTEVFREQSLSDVLRNHRDERICALFWCEPQISERASMRYHCDRGNAIGHFEERTNEPGHIQDLERTRKDGERF